MGTREIIDLFGGPMALATAAGVHLSRVYAWRCNGIPPDRWRQLVALAEVAGIDGVSYATLASATPEPARMPARTPEVA